MPTRTPESPIAAFVKGTIAVCLIALYPVAWIGIPLLILYAIVRFVKWAWVG